MSKTVSSNGFAASSHSFADAAKSLIHESDFKDFPKVDVIQLIKLVTEVSKKEKTPQEAAKEFGAPFAAFAKVFIANKSEEIIAFGFDQVSACMSGTEHAEQPKANTRTKAQPKNSKLKNESSKPGMQQAAESVAKSFINEAATRADMEDLTKTDFDDRLIACVISTAALVRQYMSKQITVEDFIEKLGNGEIKGITMEILKASGMDKQLAEKLDVQSLSEIENMAPSMVAFIALTAAYEMVREAQEDLEIAKAHRAEIEAACRESIALIRQYRQEMEEVVNKYLTDRIEIFESGFEAMDKAILENDSNGYIQGNTAIQEILGYKPQFTNQEEFDDLMDSNEDFKL